MTDTVRALLSCDSFSRAKERFHPSYDIVIVLIPETH